MNEVPPRKSAGWKPSQTFASQMHHVHGDDKPIASTTEAAIGEEKV
jgi:hypothetical protein